MILKLRSILCLVAVLTLSASAFSHDPSRPNASSEIDESGNRAPEFVPDRDIHERLPREARILALELASLIKAYDELPQGADDHRTPAQSLQYNEALKRWKRFLEIADIASELSLPLTDPGRWHSRKLGSEARERFESDLRGDVKLGFFQLPPERLARLTPSEKKFLASDSIGARLAWLISAASFNAVSKGLWWLSFVSMVQVSTCNQCQLPGHPFDALWSSFFGYFALGLTANAMYRVVGFPMARWFGRRSVGRVAKTFETAVEEFWSTLESAGIKDYPSGWAAPWIEEKLSKMNCAAAFEPKVPTEDSLLARSRLGEF